jgi:3'(2'), 5'-bisphosphate nucleotidase
MSFDRELQTALEAAQKAGSLIRKDYDAFVAIPNAPASITTETDRNAQEIILQHLQSVFPDDALCAEENTATLQAARRSGPRTWIVDPIDGTRGFAMKNGEFSVMIGLVVEGILAVGVVLEPVPDRVTYATQAGGCWNRIGDSSASPCRVSSVSHLSESALVKSHSRSVEHVSLTVKAIGPARVIERYSAGVKLALVARGEAELYVNTYPRFHDWDICAGHILVTEAGGRVSTLSGDEIRYCTPGHFQTGGLLATNGVVHPDAVNALSVVKIDEKL